MLVAPLSHLEMILGFVISAVIRSVIIAVGIFFIALFFTNETSIAHFGLFVFYTMAVSAIFALLGLLVGLWSNGFEQLNILTTFVITPFTFLGGVFYSIEMLPEKLQLIAVWNPFFYFVDGIRYSMIGISEANTAIGLTLIIGLVLGLTGLVTYLFKIGWRIRE